jgi:hypothetical protein
MLHDTITRKRAGGGEPTGYDPTELFGRMRLTEAEILIVIPIAGQASHYREDYQGLADGSVVELTTEPNEHQGATRFTVTADTVISGVTGYEGEPGDPPARFFEGTIVATDSETKVPTDEVFGVFFPGGTAVLIDSAPDSDYTHRRILAGIAIRDDGEL